MDKIKKAKTNLEQYLEGKVKDYHALTHDTAQHVMSISTFMVWRSWRDLQDICDGDLS